MRPHEAKTAPTVVERTPDGEGRGWPDQRPGKRVNTLRIHGILRHPGKGAGDLRKRAGFAPNAGTKLPVAGEQECDSGRREQKKIAAEDDHDQPPRNAAYRG